METLSSSQFAALYGLSDRTVRNYCRQGKIAGAFLTGKTWNIPINSLPPEKKRKKLSPLLKALKEQKDGKIRGGIYHRVQIDLTYNSNHIEGSQLTKDQTRMIFETHTVVPQEGTAVKVDDIIETVNHFRCVDFIIDHAFAPLSEGIIKQLHKVLKSGTADSTKDWFAVGDYKRLPNEVGGIETTAPENVSRDMKNLLEWYTQQNPKTEEDIIELHQRFETIHPFQDGNGRVGRLIMFKECLANNLVPFIIDENLRFFYYRGLREWPHVKGYLIDTCLTAQDNFKELLDYFRIQYS
jgi:Fic family protein